MIWLVLLAVVIALGVVKYRSLFRGFEKIDSMFPGPATLPILGNAWEFFGDGHLAFNNGVRYVFLYRRSFRVWIGPVPYILITSPSDIEVVLSSQRILEKSDSYDFMMPWVGRGLLTSYDNRWRKHRKVLTPAFHFNILDGFLEIFNENAQILCRKLENEVGKKSFDAMPYMKLCALDNICETAMGTRIQAQDNPESDYVKSVKMLCEVVVKRSFSPWLRPDFIFSLTHYGRTQRKCLKVIHGFSRDVVQKRIQSRKDSKTDDTEGKMEQNECGTKKRVAFLDLLLDLADNGTFSLQDVLEEVDTFMFEGHDTVTSALSFTVHNLAHYPEYQEKAYQEQLEIFGGNDRPTTPRDLLEMKYLEMIIKETLRLYASVPIIGRRVKEDIALDPWCVIPKGSQVILGIAGVQRNPEVWERPLEFYPDHFLPENVLKRHPFAYVPFSAGPRNCIGMKFAMMEMKCTLSHILRKFKFEPANPVVDIKPAVAVVTASTSGFNVTLQKRSVL